MNLPFFNDLNLELVQNYYRIKIDYEVRRLQLDLNFENTSISEDNLNLVINILENLDKWIDKAKESINKEFQTESEVDDYIDFHIEELLEGDFEILLKDADKSLSRKEQILSILKLKRIGFYPEAENYYAIFDFVAEEKSNQVLVVNINKNGELDHITWES